MTEPRPDTEEPRTPDPRSDRIPRNEAADRLREMLEGDRITRSGRLLGLGDLTLALATERRNVVAEIDPVIRRARTIINEGTERTPNNECADVVDDLDRLLDELEGEDR